MADQRPVFVDIEEKTYCMKPDLIPETVDVIIPVHLFGHPCDMDKIMSKGKFVIEDAAQAITARYKGKYCGTIGDCGIFSFNQSKQVSCGEGGVLITNRDDVADIARLVRNHGEVIDNGYTLGYNYRMTEIEATIAYYKFLDVDNIIRCRQVGMREMEQYFGKYRTCDINAHAAFVYPIRVHDNKRIAKEMTERGFFLRPGYLTLPLHRVPIYNGNFCPVADRMWADELIVTDIIRKDRNEIFRFAEALNEVLACGQGNRKQTDEVGVLSAHR
jgi:perosamine synthetase